MKADVNVGYVPKESTKAKKNRKTNYIGILKYTEEQSWNRVRMRTRIKATRSGTLVNGYRYEVYLVQYSTVRYRTVSFLY